VNVSRHTEIDGRTAQELDPQGKSAGEIGHGYGKSAGL